MKVSVVALGFVGSAMFESFKNRITEHGKDWTVYGYDRYKNGGIGTLENCVDSDIIFTALPTLYDTESKTYDNAVTEETLMKLNDLGYNKIIVIKSTVLPEYTESLSKKFPTMEFINNPEFLCAYRAYQDFHEQKHIVLGKTDRCSNESFNKVKSFYSELYKEAEISECKSTESELMKISCNTFYAVKIQYFNELYLMMDKLNVDFNEVVKLMLKNGWINPMHTMVPGRDGKLSYGSYCFPKDTNSLLYYMKDIGTRHAILEACIIERNEMRDDHENCK